LEYTGDLHQNRERKLKRLSGDRERWMKEAVEKVMQLRNEAAKDASPERSSVRQRLRELTELLKMAPQSSSFKEYRWTQQELQTLEEVYWILTKVVESGRCEHNSWDHSIRGVRMLLLHLPGQEALRRFVTERLR
jgi:hypothetical protein